MMHLNKFEDFKYKNFTIQDIIQCVKNNGYIYAKIVNDYPDNDVESPLRALSVDNDGLVTVEIDGGEYEVGIDNIEKIDY